jgi:uncharacterized protein with von Willebrand factor type A (vWA) domain
LVEHTAENRGVAGSIPALATSPVEVRLRLRRSYDDFARVARLSIRLSGRRRQSRHRRRIDLRPISD